MLFPVTYASATVPVVIPVQPVRRRLVAVLIGLAAMLASPALAELRLEGCFQGRGEGPLDLPVIELGDGSGAYFVVAGTAITNECIERLRRFAEPGGTGAPVRRIDWKFVF